MRGAQREVRSAKKTGAECWVLSAACEKRKSSAKCEGRGGEKAVLDAEKRERRMRSAQGRAMAFVRQTKQVDNSEQLKRNDRARASEPLKRRISR